MKEQNTLQSLLPFAVNKLSKAKEGFLYPFSQCAKAELLCGWNIPTGTKCHHLETKLPFQYITNCGIVAQDFTYIHTFNRENISNLQNYITLKYSLYTSIYKAMHFTFFSLHTIVHISQLSEDLHFYQERMNRIN